MPEAPELNLRSVLTKEKHPGLSRLDPDFYEKVSQLINELEAEKRSAEPDSKHDEDITEQFEGAKGQVRDIILIRMRKIVSMAELQSKTMDKSDAPAMTREENGFYNALLSLMTAWRQDCHNRFAKKRVKKEVKKETDIAPDLLKEPGKPEVPKENKTDITKNYIVVRLLKNVQTFVGMDNRNYTLAKEDVVTVPAVNGRALIKRKVAVQIVQSGS